MKYCKDAFKLLGVKVVCGMGCPMYKDCPRIILEDAVDKGVSKAIKRLIQIIKGDSNDNSSNRMGR